MVQRSKYGLRAARHSQKTIHFEPPTLTTATAPILGLSVMCLLPLSTGLSEASERPMVPSDASTGLSMVPLPVGRSSATGA